MGNTDNYGSADGPLYYNNKQLNQFVLDVEEYKDNNYYINVNDISTVDERWNILNKKKERFWFFDFTTVSGYKSKTYMVNQNQT